MVDGHVVGPDDAFRQAFGDGWDNSSPPDDLRWRAYQDDVDRLARLADVVFRRGQLVRLRDATRAWLGPPAATKPRPQPRARGRRTRRRGGRSPTTRGDDDPPARRVSLPFGAAS